MKRIKILILLLVMLSFLGCKKKRFEARNTIIRLILPSGYEDFFKIKELFFTENKSLEDDGSVVEMEGDYNIYQFSGFKDIDFNSAEDVIEIEINWEDYDNTSNASIDPWKKMYFALLRSEYWTEEGVKTLFTTADGNGGGFYEIVAEQSVKLKAGRIYEWDIENNEFIDTKEKTDKKNNSSSSSEGNGISGKWMLMGACVNANNESTWFNFESGSGQSFSSDCNSACAGLGVKFFFDYTITNSSINITWTSVNDYCGVSSDTPAPETLTYTLSGDILTINGQNYQRQ